MTVSVINKRIGFVAGAFKPPHNGHFNMVKQALKENDSVTIVMSEKSREEFTSELSRKIWEIYLQYLPGAMLATVEGSPVTAVYESIEALGGNEEVHGGATSEIGVNVYADEADMDRYNSLERYRGYLGWIIKTSTPRLATSSDTRKTILDGDDFSQLLPTELSAEDIVRVTELMLSVRNLHTCC
tara:strand:+ start:24031 stop:24585 length:555 start_codon:yes stop_codon:yes gene_type:complete